MDHFQLFSMILKFPMGHFLSFYTDFYGPFSKLMGLWRMAPCLPNHWRGKIFFRPMYYSNTHRVFFQSVGNGAGSLAIGKITQFWYDLGKVQKSMNLIN